MNESRTARIDFLGKLPKDSIVAEVGVWQGVHALDIHQTCYPKHLYLIDPWVWNGQWHIKHEKGNVEELAEVAFNRASGRFKGHENVSFIREPSIQACGRFTDGFFDWVYIDADHRFKEVVEDLEAWWPKIKKGGYLSGHDFFESIHEQSLKDLDIPPTEKERKENGVTKALNMFSRKNKVEIGFTSTPVVTEDKPGAYHAQCWAIKKS